MNMAESPGKLPLRKMKTYVPVGWLVICFVLPAILTFIVPVSAGSIFLPDITDPARLGKPDRQYSNPALRMAGDQDGFSSAFQYNVLTDTWSADNFRHRTRIRITGSGSVVFSAGGGSFGMNLAEISRDNRRSSTAPGGVSANGRELEVSRGAFTEWYKNAGNGIEQGMVLAARPEGFGPLQVRWSLSGNLSPSLEGQVLVLSGEAGPVFAYSGLAAEDAAGRDLPARLLLEGKTLMWEIDDAGATYPITIDPTVTQVAVLKASDGNTNDNFGMSASLSGDTAIIGSPYADAGGTNKGQAYIYSRNTGGTDTWGQVKILQASDGANNDCFGKSVSIDGNTAVVGSICAGATSTGEAYVYYRDRGGPNNWGEVKILNASDAKADAYFGQSVGVNGNIVVVGAYKANASGAYENQGQAYVYYRDRGGADQWGQVAILNASDRNTDAQFGQSVAISGSTIIVGATNATVSTNESQGKAYVFSQNQGGPDAWGEVKILTASDGESNDQLGYSVALDGDVAVVAANKASAGGWGSAGKVYVRSRNQGGPDGWGEVKILTASDGGSSEFGDSVSIAGTRIVVGAPWATADSVITGKSYLFSRDRGGANAWSEEQIIQATDRQEWDAFGYAVAANGSTVLVTAENATVGGRLGQGKAYIFTNVIPPTPVPQPIGGSDDGPAPVRREQRVPLQRQSSTVSVSVGQIGKTPIVRVEVTGIDIRDLIVTAREADGPGTGMLPPPGIVYEYVDITPARFLEISDSKIIFVVPLAWIAEHNLLPEDIVLYHNNGKEWEALPTTLTAIRESEAFYSAEGAGFSRFAITGQVNLTAKPGNLTVGVAPPAYQAPVQTATTRVTVAAGTLATTQTPVPVVTPAAALLPPWPFVIIGAGAVILVAGVILIRRFWIRRQNPALFRKYD